MNRKIEPRLFWLILFIISVATAITIYTVQSFDTDKQVAINTRQINETEIEQKFHDKQTDFIANRQDRIMTIVNADVAYLKNKFEQDLHYDKLINEKLNILLAENNSLNK